MNEDEKVVEIKSEARSSITLTRNSKGYNWEIKTYYQEGEEEKALNTTRALDDQMKARYS